MALIWVFYAAVSWAVFLTVVTAPRLWGWALSIGLLLAAVGWFAMISARRLDRLHRRIESANRALSDQLLRRAQAATELALSGLLDPASALLLHQAAAGAVQAGRADADVAAADPFHVSGLTGFSAAREDAESDLSRALRATLEELPDGHAARGEATADLAGDCFRVRLARRLYNDAVASALQLRRARLVRLFRLAGHAPLPRTFEIDDEPAAVLSSAQVPGGA